MASLLFALQCTKGANVPRLDFPARPVLMVDVAGAAAARFRGADLLEEAAGACAQDSSNRLAAIYTPRPQTRTSGLL
jgi:hypothetical protein